jgi:hypothetical protein
MTEQVAMTVQAGARLMECALSQGEPGPRSYRRTEQLARQSASADQRSFISYTLRVGAGYR